MKKMKPVTLLPLLLLCALPFCLGSEDDLVFDDVGEETPTAVSTESESPSPPTKTSSSKKWQRVEKLLGMPDAIASVGHVFKLHVPRQAFAGDVDFYEARGTSGKGLPHWLRWDEPASALYGVPSRKDVGRHRVVIKAFGKHGDIAQDSFLVHVVPEKREHYKHKDGKKRCTEEQDRTMLTILIDARYENLKPSAKVNALENLAGFLGLHTNSLSIQPELGRENSPSTSVVLSGPGNVGRRHEKHSTIVQWQVGCDGHFWPHQIDTIKLIPEQARDGTLSEVMELPVYQWRVRSDSTDYARNRRDTAGSGDDLLPDDEDEDYEDEDYEDEDYDGNEGITESPQEPKQKPVIHPAGGIVDEHPHRHHHGEDSIAGIGAGVISEEDFIWRNAEINNSIFNATTSTTTSPPSIADTSPSSTTTPSTTTTTTTTTTTESSTTSSSTTIESTNFSTTSTTMESSSPSEVTDSTSTTTITSTSTQTVSSGTVDTLAENTTTPLTYTNLTQVATSSSNTQSGNVTTDSLTVDNEEPLTTERDIDNETDTDITTTLQPNIFVASESTTSSVGLSTAASGSVVVEGTSEPNATSIFTVNATSDEYSEASVPTREGSFGSPPTSYTTTPWTDNATERVPDEPLEPIDSMHVPVFSSTPTTTESTTTTTTTTTTTPSTPISTTSTTTTSTTPEPTTPPTTTTTTTSTTTTMPPEPTTPPTTSTTTTITTTTTTTERIDFGVRNLPPKVERRLKKLPITQGKLLSYTIPADTFSDPEDGNTKNLRLRIYEKGAPLKPTYWLQFNEDTQEVYGLPLEQYGTYPFEVIATDSEGLSASDKLEISVQQHKQLRAVNHEFHIYLKIEKRSRFPTNVDWQLKVMRSLAELYGDSDLRYITVRSIDITDDQAIYTWTNDSLVRSNTCPQDEINRLYRVLVSDEKTEEPSSALISALGPEITPKRVVYQGLEQCQQTKETQVNKYPVPRNQIDQLNATVGQLFVYRVPKDTFFDEEDGDTRSMKASLLTANRTEIPSWDWLQFDSSNQEFYGVPLKQDVGRKTYQLVVKDREGLEATDSLVAEVHPAPVMRHVVEISMTLNMPLETFAHSAQKKREFIQKLQKLYGDRNASAISLLSISGNHDTTTVTWRNLTLPTYECPHDEITRLRRVLVNDNKSFTDELNREFNSDINQPEFAVIQITVSQLGACQDMGVGGPGEMPPVDDSTSVGASHDDYLITFVLPAIIVAAMLILAGIIACILYKRRRSGKMSISEKDDERQSFRSKGIPVIFQDELDEKPDPGNKSPIILKEEKPPLPPPEYQRAEDGADIPMLSKENSEEPYQPPPPFATNRDSSRQNRPKPTPTYRKPPPYVPP